MEVRVLAFAALRDRLGFSEKMLVLPPDSTVADALETVFGGPPPRAVACAVNQEYADGSVQLRDGDELALLPPVAGGAPIARIQSEPIDLAPLLDAIRDPGCGAIACFLGTARELDGETLVHLEYEAYQPMAERFLAEIGDELAERFGIVDTAIVHRIGRLAVGEVSVAIAVSSPHRAEALDAVRHAIERIKARAPIWKKEVTRESERWVESERLDES